MAGDAVLVALAEKMQQMCQETDIVMRLGGDEFAMYLRGVHTRAEAEGFFKENKEGVAIMCRAIEEMRNQEREEGRAEGRTTELIALVKDGLLAAAEAAKRLQLSEKEFMDLMEDGH